MLTEYTTKIKNKLSKAGIDFTTYNHIRTIEDEIEDLYLLERLNEIMNPTRPIFTIKNSSNNKINRMWGMKNWKR